MKRLGFWSLVVLLAAVAGGTLSYKPWKAFLAQRSQTAEHRSQMEASERRSADLARKKAELESNKGREKQAREQGFRRPGEVLVDES